MKRFAISAFAVLALVSFALPDAADAARLGGGRSLGAQRQITPPPATTAPGAAANPVLPGKTATPAAAPASSSGSRWLGPIAGLAAGLGLAALLAHFGLPEGFASVLLIALVVVGIALVARRLLMARTATAPQPSPGMPGGGYAPRIETALPAAAQGGNPPWPPGFDAAAFVREAKVQFNRLQAVYDAGDRAALAEVLTPDMMAEVGHDLDARGAHHATEVVTLNAEVLEVTTEADRHWASVRFTGLIREDGAAVAKPLDEVWNLTKPVDGSSGWLVAGIQQVA
jgi:predicted lipid-binding transport protein (Tim44 family)